MTRIIIHEGTTAFVVAYLQKRDDATGEFVPATDAAQVEFEVFDPEGVSLGAKDLDSGASLVGVVTKDGEQWAKFRAQFVFPDPGVYNSVVRAQGSGGGTITGNDAIPVEDL